MVGTIVEYLLILAEIGCLCFIEIALQTSLCIQSINACAMSRNCNSKLVGHLTKIGLFEEVTHLHLTSKVKIGKGKIGLEAFRRIVNHPSLRDLPFYLETPCDLQGYKDEIALLKGLCE